jgi:cyclophilin family peptidyl-prolyl cis-trans isomerase
MLKQFQPHKIFIVFAFTLLSIQSFSQFNGKPQYQIITHRAGSYLGTINMELFPLVAPLHTRNFDSLVSTQFFDSTAFHRVVPGFVIQGGDPNSINGPISTWGQGQPWQPTVNAEFSVVRHERGRLGAARDVDTNSANSQFYFCVAPALFLDGQYTVYGQVTSGMVVVDTIVSSPRDANDVPLQKIEMFITYTGIDSTIPASPTLTAPADNSLGILNTQSFSWSAVPTAVMYTVELSTDSLFGTIAFSNNAGSTTSVFPALQGSQTYFWRVKANNGGKESAYSNVFKFNSGAAAAQLIAPADSAINIVLNPIFEWSNAVGATDYTLQVSKGSIFSVGNMIYNQSGLTGTTQQVNGLLPNFKYYWRVRSANNGTQGFYSAKYSFTTGTTTAVNEIIKGEQSFSIENIFPNPAKNNLGLMVVAGKHLDALLQIKDVAGKLVFERQEKLSLGENRLRVDIKNLQSGFYFVMLSADGVDLKEKFEVR